MIVQVCTGLNDADLEEEGRSCDDVSSQFASCLNQDVIGVWGRGGEVNTVEHCSYICPPFNRILSILIMLHTSLVEQMIHCLLLLGSSILFQMELLVGTALGVWEFFIIGSGMRLMISYNHITYSLPLSLSLSLSLLQ